MRFTGTVVLYGPIQWARTAADRRQERRRDRDAKRSALSADEVRAFTDRAPRCTVALQVLCTVPGETPGADLIWKQSW